MNKGAKTALALAGGSALLGGAYWLLYGRIRTSKAGSNAYNGRIVGAALAAWVPARLLKAITLWESDFYSYATKTHPDGVSHGLTGIIASTARANGYKGEGAALNSPSRNLYYGAKALRAALSHAGGNLERALTVYHRGAAYAGLDSDYVGSVRSRAESVGLHLGVLAPRAAELAAGDTDPALEPLSSDGSSSSSSIVEYHVGATIPPAA